VSATVRRSFHSLSHRRRPFLPADSFLALVSAKKKKRKEGGGGEGSATRTRRQRRLVIRAGAPKSLRHRSGGGDRRTPIITLFLYSSHCSLQGEREGGKIAKNGARYAFLFIVEPSSLFVDLKEGERRRISSGFRRRAGFVAAQRGEKEGGKGSLSKQRCSRPTASSWIMPTLEEGGREEEEGGKKRRAQFSAGFKALS